ncbi:MAG: glycosyltransferase family 39 protein [Allosphingosinicella sp.]|uniref:glycosyltransferase family 39 protein n=1 Tax=Allosphingosinicella sp. TaxID=2823234 RepID=UPI0039358796
MQIDRSAALGAGGAPGWARLAALALAAALALVGLAAAMVLAVGIVERFDAIALLLLLLWLGAMAQLVRRAASARPDWSLLAGIAALSLLIRWWSAQLTFDVALGADPMNYTNLATAVLEGRGLVTDDWQYGRDLRAYFPPLYPLALAGFWAVFGVSAYATLAMNTLIDAIAAWCIADAGRRLGRPAAGRVAAIAYFAWPAFALSAGIPQKESLTLLFVLLLLRGVATWLAEPPEGARRWRHGLWLGLWWGLLSLTQPSLALAPGAVALVLIWQRGFGPVLRLGLTALPTLIAVLLPWWIRNWMLFGAFVPFTTASGMMINSALVGLRVPFPPGLFELPEPERARIMGGLAREVIRDNPIGFLGEALRSLVYGFAYEESPLARYRHTTPAISAADHARLAPLLQGAWAALLASAAAGAWRRFRERSVDPVLLYALVLLLSIGLTNIWFEFGERHRLILTPFLLLIAAGFWLGKRQARGQEGAAR